MIRPSLLVVLALCSAPALAQTVHFSFTDQARLGSAVSLDARARIAAALEQAGHKAVDITPLYERLFKVGMLVPDFSRPPPDGWPAPLREDWIVGHDACREQVGTIDGDARARMKAAGQAMDCQRLLSRALYGRYLDHLGATSALEVTAVDAEGGQAPPLRLRAILFDPRESGGARGLEVTRPRGQWEEAIALAVGDLLAKKGARVHHSLDRTLPARPGGGVPAALQAETPPPSLPALPLPARCEPGLPARLQITPETLPLSKVVAKRYDASVPSRLRRRTEPLACALTVREGDGMVFGQRLKSVEATLGCEGAMKTQHRASLAVGPVSRGGKLHDQLSSQLLTDLLAGLCRGRAK